MRGLQLWSAWGSLKWMKRASCRKYWMTLPWKREWSCASHDGHHLQPATAQERYRVLPQVEGGWCCKGGGHRHILPVAGFLVCWIREPGGGSELEASRRLIRGTQGTGHHPEKFKVGLGCATGGKHYEPQPPEDVGEEGREDLPKGSESSRWVFGTGWTWAPADGQVRAPESCPEKNYWAGSAGPKLQARTLQGPAERVPRKLIEEKGRAQMMAQPFLSQIPL